MCLLYIGTKGGPTESTHGVCLVLLPADNNGIVAYGRDDERVSIGSGFAS